LTLKLVRVIACGVGSLAANSGDSETFPSRLTCQTDHVTLTFDLGVMALVDRYACLQNLKFAGLTVR